MSEEEAEMHFCFRDGHAATAVSARLFTRGGFIFRVFCFGAGRQISSERLSFRAAFFDRRRSAVAAECVRIL